jgi:uncharacterized protein (TIGR00369 family)
MGVEQFKKLEEIYLSAPLHKFYDTLSIHIERRGCEISLDVDQKYFHGGGAVHGSVYFKLLDDAAYFACQSEISDKYIVTKKFNINFLRPISEGRLIAKGDVIKITNDIYFADAQLYNEKEKLIATGTGQFVKGRVDLEELNFNQ